MKFPTISAIAAIAAIAIVAPANAASIVADPVFFSATDDEATLQGLGVPSLTFGDTTIYIGSQQVAGDNQDPILTSFTNGTRNWLVTDYETTGTDGRGIGLLWDGGSDLYAAFTVDGTQGTPDQDFRRFTENGWLTSYGAGGGATVSVLLKLDPLTGAGLSGTFITSLLSDMTSNTVIPTGLDFTGDGNVVFYGDSFHSPRNVDGDMQEQTEVSDPPFSYTAVFDPNLETALCAEAPGWDGVPLNSQGSCVSDDEPVATVPEPGTIAGLSLFGLGWLLSRRRGNG